MIATLEAPTARADQYDNAGNYAAALPLRRHMLEQCEREHGCAYADTIAARNMLALTYRRAGDYGAAEPLYRQAIDGAQRVLGFENCDLRKMVSKHASSHQSSDTPTDHNSVLAQTPCHVFHPFSLRVANRPR